MTDAPILAGFWRRFSSGLTDLFLIMVVFEVAAATIPAFRAWLMTVNADLSRLWQMSLWETIAIFVYYMVLLGPPGGGATIGYRLVRIRLVDQASYSRPGWWQVLLWFIGTLLLPIGWVLYWSDDRRRMLHNTLSRTLVIYLPK